MNKGILFLLIFSLITIAAGFYSCTKDEIPASLVNPGGCDTGTMSYQHDIVEIINNSCSFTPCHVPGNGNYDYTRYEVLADRIRSGRLEERLLLPSDHALHMPQGFDLDACNLYKLRLWIHQGFPNN